MSENRKLCFWSQNHLTPRSLESTNAGDPRRRVGELDPDLVSSLVGRLAFALVIPATVAEGSIETLHVTTIFAEQNKTRTNGKGRPETRPKLLIALVAGGGFEPPTFGL